MDVLGFQIDWQHLLQTAREFALPRLAESAGLLLLAAVFYVAARWVLGRLEVRLTDRTVTEIDDCVVRLVRRALLLSIAFWAGWRIVAAWELGRTADVVAAGWIVALAFPAGRFATDLLEIAERKIVPRTKTRIDDTALPLLNKFVHFVIIGIGVLMALQHLEIPIAPFLGGAGVIGVALSFAAKDTLSNLIAGILLILDRPFEVGDRIQLWQAPAETGHWGDVVEIGLRATKIRNPDNVIVVIPNNEIMMRDIINYTASGDDIRLRIPIGIAYDADVDLAKKLILEQIERIDGVQPEPRPVVILRRFGDSAVDLEARLWIANARRRRAIGDELTERVKRVFDEHGIEIPYPKRDLYIKTMPEAPAQLSAPAVAPAAADAPVPASRPSEGASGDTRQASSGTSAGNPETGGDDQGSRDREPEGES